MIDTRSKKKMSSQTALAVMAAAALMGGMHLPASEGKPRRGPTVPTPDELKWMGGLNSYRQKDWVRRFQLGLTDEQRRYVDEQLKEMQDDAV